MAYWKSIDTHARAFIIMSPGMALTWRNDKVIGPGRF